LAALRGDEERMNKAGYDSRICFVEHGETAHETISAALAADSFACIMVGAGVRTDPDEFLLSVSLLNLIHEAAPQAKVCFSTGPTDSLAAVKRWI
jgi:hypothetical protein